MKVTVDCANNWESKAGFPAAGNKKGSINRYLPQLSQLQKEIQS